MSNIMVVQLLIKIIRILGLISLVSYILVFISTWMLANMEGYIYFSGGEPSLMIKYSEWILGFLGIIVASHYLLMELYGYTCRWNK